MNLDDRISKLSKYAPNLWRDDVSDEKDESTS